MQITSQNKNISFRGLYWTPETVHQKGFGDVVDYLVENATKNDLFVRTIEETDEATQAPIKKFRVNAQTLSGDMGFEVKSESLSMEHLKESVQKAIKGLTDMLLDHHATKNPPPAARAKLEVISEPIKLPDIMTRNRQN